MDKKSIFKTAKLMLLEQYGNAKYFTGKAFNTIISDRKKAEEILEKGGNPQEFYVNSETAKTDLYIKNSGAYCMLLQILEGLKV